MPEPARLQWELSPEPGWLRTDFGEVFCWYHAPRGVSKDTAVILCDAYGSDRMNLHLAYRHLALALSFAGYATLRVDYPGTCDSSGSPRDPDRMRAWLGSLNEAADFLKRRSGAANLTAFGALIGGTLASCLAAEREDVTKLAVWGCYQKGSDYIRTANLLERFSGGNPKNLKPEDWQTGDMESLGFYFGASTVSALDTVDLTSRQFPSLRNALLIEWDSVSDARKLRLLLQRQDVAVEYIETPLDVGAASLERQEVPYRTIRAILSWLDTHSADACPKSNEHGGAQLERAINLTEENSAVFATERVVAFGDDGEIFGIVTEPADYEQDASLPTVIIVNGGNNHRVGINRNHTEWARAWARAGLRVVRFDIRGLGDSPPLRASDLNKLYRAESSEDITVVMNHLQADFDTDRFVVIGLCAGAFQALHVARSDARVVGLVLIELLRFYRSQFTFPFGLRKIRKTMDALRIPGRLWGPRLSRWFRSFSSRGTNVLVVYQAGEEMLYEFQREVGEALLSSSSEHAVSLRLLEPSNHILSPLRSQAELRENLNDWLSRNFLPDRIERLP